MAQYLLSVHGSDTDPIPDNVEEMYAAVDQFNKEVQAAGSWVFAGGLNPRRERLYRPVAAERACRTDRS